MTWADRRRFFIIAIIVAVLLTIVALTTVATVYNAPSCADHTQNQGEDGVDCGGPCAYLCRDLETAPVVRFTKIVESLKGRFDLLSYIDNPNQSAAARSVVYTISLYGTDHTLLKKDTGLIDLPPGGTRPLYLPNFYNGQLIPAEAFLTIEPDSVMWYSSPTPIPLPKVTDTTLGGSVAAPRITARLTNPGTTSFINLKVVTALFDSAGNLIAASQTLVPKILPQGGAQVTFTWNTPFRTEPARIEVLPLASLSP